jgi:PAS domain-containing protein
MTVDTKRSHILIDDWVALSTAKIRFAVFIVGERLRACRQWARRSVFEIGWKAIRERGRMKEAARQRAVRLTKLLTDTPDAVVLMDKEHRLVMANDAALLLFGISERNICKFTLDAFLLNSEIPGSEQTGRPFIKNKGQWHSCKISRLNGSSLVAEIAFHPNVAPGRHLSRFRNVKSCRHLPSQM